MKYICTIACLRKLVANWQSDDLLKRVRNACYSEIIVNVVCLLVIE